MQTSVTTIERFILDQEDRYPEATGELSNLLYDIALAAKIIAAAIRRAGLVNILGTARHRERPGRGAAEARRLRQRDDQELPEAHRPGLRHGHRRKTRTSSRSLPNTAVGKYAVLFDPLDGSSNIDVNSAVGTIFSIYRRLSMEGRGTVADVLQPGLPAGRGRLRDVRLEHDAGLHHRSGRARLHARSRRSASSCCRTSGS